VLRGEDLEPIGLVAGKCREFLMEKNHKRSNLGGRYDRGLLLWKLSGKWN
jgi:hypothetical protein